MIIHYSIRITGRVQGVGFRFETRRMARLYGIKGFVKNLSDGSVFIEAEAEEQQLSNFVAWCRKGPAHALVEDLELKKGDLKNYSVFDIG